VCSAINDRPGRTGVRASERQDGLHPLLGGMVFSASAWSVAARNHWIGWNEEARREYLRELIATAVFDLALCARARSGFACPGVWRCGGWAAAHPLVEAVTFAV
jgi:hypothetical protein